MKIARMILIIGLLSALLGCWHKLKLLETPEIKNPVIDVRSDPTKPFLAGFGKAIITPKMKVWMAGFDPGQRRSAGVHDDLFARALVLKQGEEKLALVSLDLIGLNREDIEKYKSLVQGFRPDQILIACTHTHSGPDTMGVWGLIPFARGNNPEYMKQIGQGIVSAIKEAEASLKPAEMWTTVYQMNPSLMFNKRDTKDKDDTMGIMVFLDSEGITIATLINLTGHPEVMWKRNRLISADYPGVVYKLVEKKYGGGAIFFNGALGALVSPNVENPEAEHSWAELDDFGSRVANEVDRGMGLLVKENQPFIRHKMSLIQPKVSNDIYALGVEFGLFERKAYEGRTLITEVNLIEIGTAQIVTFPGEAYPKQGLKIRSYQKRNSFQFGLADDELAYILYPEDYDAELYKYERSLCVGPELATLIDQALIELLK